MFTPLRLAALALLLPGAALAQGDGTIKPKPANPASRGVIRPPAVDPGIHVAVPPATKTRTPVIRPPGTPGGRQDVVPK